MALFEAVSGHAAWLAKAGTKKVKNTGKIAQLILSNHGAEEELNKLYCKLGKRYYGDHGLAPDAGYEAVCDKMTEIKARIAENKALIAELKIDGVNDDEVTDPDDLDD